MTAAAFGFAAGVDAAAAAAGVAEEEEEEEEEEERGEVGMSGFSKMSKKNERAVLSDGPARVATAVLGKESIECEEACMCSVGATGVGGVFSGEDGWGVEGLVLECLVGGDAHRDRLGSRIPAVDVVTEVCGIDCNSEGEWREWCDVGGWKIVDFSHPLDFTEHY